jgi:hypothetical protein
VNIRTTKNNNNSNQRTSSIEPGTSGSVELPLSTVPAPANVVSLVAPGDAFIVVVVVVVVVGPGDGGGVGGTGVGAGVGCGEFSVFYVLTKNKTMMGNAKLLRLVLERELVAQV